MRVLRNLLDFAMKEKLRRDNPALGIKLAPIKTSGYHSWTEDELHQYEQRHPIGTKARLAFDLLLYTSVWIFIVRLAAAAPQAPGHEALPERIPPS